MVSIPFQTIDWANIEKVIYLGETGTLFCKIQQYNIELAARFYIYLRILIRSNLKHQIYRVP